MYIEEKEFKTVQVHKSSSEWKQSFGEQSFISWSYFVEPVSCNILKTIHISIYFTSRENIFPRHQYKISLEGKKKYIEEAREQAEWFLFKKKIYTYAVVVCTSCQLLLKFCFNSFIRFMPSFCFISTRCLSFADKTCRKVVISSSSYKQGGKWRGKMSDQVRHTMAEALSDPKHPGHPLVHTTPCKALANTSCV